MSRCNLCTLKSIRHSLKGTGSRIHLRPSGFMGGIDVFVVPKGKKLPPKSEMIEPNDEYPNGNEAYSKYHRAWFMEIGKRCCCD